MMGDVEARRMPADAERRGPAGGRPARGAGVARRRPAGWTARLLRLPRLLYRVGLGWLLGHRLAEITHRGRTSGRIHHTVVEVLRFEPAPVHPPVV
jgi:hypothetical protein